MYSHTYMHVITINEKRSHEFGGGQRGICGRTCKEERKGGELYHYIIISKIKIFLKDMD